MIYEIRVSINIVPNLKFKFKNTKPARTSTGHVHIFTCTPKRRHTLVRATCGEGIKHADQAADQGTRTESKIVSCWYLTFAPANRNKSYVRTGYVTGNKARRSRIIQNITCFRQSSLLCRSREMPPKDNIAAVLDLQSNIGQWRLCDRLYRALGHTRSTIPIAPEGVKDWRWATALAVIFLRRRPDVIDDTYNAYRSGIAQPKTSVAVLLVGKDLCIALLLAVLMLLQGLVASTYI